jgi:toxin ParE1/3/4
MAANKLPLVWSREALGDIDQIWEYYAGVAGRTTADRVLREIARAVVAVEEFSLAGRSRDEVRSGLRSLAANPHVVFYRINRDRPEIVRVLDGWQDIGEIFAEDEGS